MPLQAPRVCDGVLAFAAEQLGFRLRYLEIISYRHCRVVGGIKDEALGVMLDSLTPVLALIPYQILLPSIGEHV